MASIGSYYITVMPDMSKFNGEIVSGLNKSGTDSGKQFSSSFLSSIKSTALGVAIGNLVTSGIGEVMSGLETGIQRLDIIENFPRVMANLGVETSTAAAAIDRIQQSLVGLPTSLQDGVQSVQRLTTAVGDVDRATDIFIAFNNALVSGAAPASLQASALEQFSQAVAKGKPDMLEWRSMLNAMPAQLEQVAQAMGMTSAELGEGLRKGDIAMDDFLDTIIQLNDEGVPGFGSFSEQVTTATSTIGTALTNVKNRIGAGWASILDVIGQEKIASTINTLSTNLLGFMQGVGNALNWFKYTVLGTDIDESLATIGDNISEWFGYFTEGLPSVKDVASAFVDLVDNALKWIADNGDTVAVVLGAILTVIAAIIGQQIALKVTGLIASVQGLFTLLMANPFMVVLGLVLGLVGGLVAWFTQTEDGRKEWEKLTKAFKKAVDGIKAKWETFRLAWTKTWSNIKTTVENIWGGIKDFFKNTWDKIKSIFTGGAEGSTGPTTAKFINLRDKLKGIWDAISGAVRIVWDAIKGIITGVAGVIVSITSGNFEGLKTSLGNIWNGVKTLASTVWGGIKSTIGNLVSGAATVASNVWNGMKSTASTVWGGIKSTIGNLASGAANAAKGVWDGMKSAASTAWGNIKSTASTTWNGIKSAITDPIGTAKGVISTTIGGIQGIINGLKGKTVDVGVNDKGSSVVRSLQDRIRNMYGKTVTVTVQKGGINGINVNAKAAGGGWYMTTYAAGGIATKATAGIFGEAGAEAVIPLSNRSKVRPFARAVANEMPIGSSSSVSVTGNTFIVRNDADIDRIAQRISLYQSRKMAGRL